MFRLPTFCDNNQFPVRYEVIKDSTLRREYAIGRTMFGAAGGPQTTSEDRKILGANITSPRFSSVPPSRAAGLNGQCGLAAIALLLRCGAECNIQRSFSANWARRNGFFNIPPSVPCLIRPGSA